jgi:hypothetical protein
MDCRESFQYERFMTFIHGYLKQVMAASLCLPFSFVIYTHPAKIYTADTVTLNNQQTVTIRIRTDQHTF